MGGQEVKVKVAEISDSGGEQFGVSMGSCGQGDWGKECRNLAVRMDFRSRR